ncbi:MAG: 1-(5-phosphoribosyl)-5-[(5-phosphoribosylamino)methylideneamino]imidazole-4-carboxamide isomerase [Oscillospiraceae bacterium]|jgi:phosphoribosylformimino-5-aminoimidazole carboxamide ribotide isomerase|nr:1-(5-phosphoribosyl)-5-[(5-phosphoribosylamino)methylideneamino]imidazole-4-carboxamide isomerase [Oscillospiraceae bacterium]
MLIFPAIDIKGGQCVRLYRGDFATAERVAADYMQTALSFRAAGCGWIHMVDLDGSLAGRRVNQAIYLDVAQGSGLKVELGGGIRTMEDAAFYLERGIARVILGSVALENPGLVSRAIAEYGAEKIAVGIDAKAGKVATRGWLDVNDIDYIELAKRMEALGAEYIVFTDIGRDGMLAGPNLEQLCALREAVTCKITASGGVTDIGDIISLRDAGFYGAICGRSIYAGTLDLGEAVRVCDES